MPRPSHDHVTCKICGHDYCSITVSHLRTKNGSKSDHPVVDYKEQFDLVTATCRASRRKISVAQSETWEKRGKHWTRDRVILQIQLRARPRQSLQKQRVPQPVYERYFGTWEAAIDKAGLDYEATRAIRRCTRKRVIEQIRELAAEDESLNARHINLYHPALYRVAIRRFFKSWGKALRAAGLNPKEHWLSHPRWDRPRAAAWVRGRLSRKKSIAARKAPSGLCGNSSG